MLTGKARWQEIMREPISRAEAMAMEERLMLNIGSAACGVEALESILVSRGLLKEDELMAEVRRLLEIKSEQAKATAATQSPSIQAV